MRLDNKPIMTARAIEGRTAGALFPMLEIRIGVATGHQQAEGPWTNLGQSQKAGTITKKGSIRVFLSVMFLVYSPPACHNLWLYSSANCGKGSSKAWPSIWLTGMMPIKELSTHTVGQAKRFSGRAARSAT
jgi:hypothetical protein